MEYITTQEIEKLLRLWHRIKKLQESLKVDLKNFNDADIDGTIYTMVTGNKQISGMPFSSGGDISDSTGTTALNYGSKIEYGNSEAADIIMTEIMALSAVDEKLGIAFHSLDQVQQKLIDLMVLRRCSWIEAIERIRQEGEYISKKQAQTQKRRALDYMQVVARIPVKTYEFVIGLVEVN